MKNSINVGFGVTILAKGLAGKGIDGIGHYTHELYKALQSTPYVDLTTFSFNSPIEQNFLGAATHQLSKYQIELAKSLVFPSCRMTSQLGKSKVDIIHATDHIIPIVKGIPLVTTLMDAIPLSHPEWCNLDAIGKLKVQLWKKIAKRADHILTISKYSKSEIVRYFGIEPARISVVGLGVEQRFFLPILAEEKKRVLAKYGIKGKYFINIGTLQPRKNIDNLIEAMRLLPERVRKTYNLIVIGANGWKSEALVEKLKQAEEEGWCKWLSYIPDNDMRALLQSASLMVFPSLCEGFGLPILEAFASRVPVITSNTTSIPEVVGDAAILIDPLDPSDIASAMLEVVESKEMTNDLILKGFNRAKEMSWHRCAEETLDVYKSVLENT